MIPNGSFGVNQDPAKTAAVTMPNKGISWYLDTRKLLLTSEGRTEPLRVIECPLPHLG